MYESFVTYKKIVRTTSGDGKVVEETIEKSEGPEAEKKLDEVEKEMDGKMKNAFSKMDVAFSKMHEAFASMEETFKKLF